jgi:hypothetical protein
VGIGKDEREGGAGTEQEPRGKWEERIAHFTAGSEERFLVFGMYAAVLAVGQDTDHYELFQKSGTNLFALQEWALKGNTLELVK